MEDKTFSEPSNISQSPSMKQGSVMHKFFNLVQSLIYFGARKLLSIEIENTKIKNQQDIYSAISAEAKKVAVIVDNMQQAFFSVSTGGIIVDPVTKYSEKVFGRNLVGGNVMQTLYKQLENKKEIYAAVESALVTAIGENELQWDLVEAHFPRKIEYIFPSSDEKPEVKKLLKVNISPIWDNNENLERLLFVVEDITNLEKLETQFKQEQEQTGMIECVLENSLEDLTAAIKRFHLSLKTARSKAIHLDPVSYMEMLRNLHTMKGNARQLKMRVLSDQIHQSEHLILEQMSDNIHADDSKPVIDELDKIENVLDAHSMLIQRFLRADVNGGEEIVPIYPLAIDQAWIILKKLKNQMSEDVFNQLHLAWSRIGYKSIASLASKFLLMIADISEQLGKKINLEIVNDALVSSEQAVAIQECLLHLIRNSIDHGIEKSELRTQLGKTEVGKIKIECIDHIDFFTIIYSDDGRGIDGHKIVEKALKLGLVNELQALQLSHEEKINLIFLPQFSTKDVATDISGRGFGMDVVYQTIQKLGGTFLINTELGKGLQFTIKIHHGEKNHSFQKAA